MTIIFFIESLRSGGKERRLVELLSYLKKNTAFNLILVITKNEIHYSEFNALQIPYYIIKKKSKKDPFLFFKFLKICLSLKPNMIHTWGGMVTFYSIPSSLLLQIPLIDNEITRAHERLNKMNFYFLVSKVNFFFSKRILSNSYEGLKTYNIKSKKAGVIYNGINLDRFQTLDTIDDIKNKFNISTDFTVGMVASFSKKKNYSLYFEIAEEILKTRKDITFLAIGGPDKDDPSYYEFIGKYENHPNILILGPINSGLESIMNVCDCGILLTNKLNHGEGISNAILEFFALKKPVIANDSGGTKEIILNHENGILIEKDDRDLIEKELVNILDDKHYAEKLGKSAYETLLEKFTVQRMGREYIKLYQSFQ